MKNNTISFNKKTSTWFLVAVGLILFLPIILLPPYFQPSEWSRSILFRVILTALICFLLYRFFYKKDISVFLPKWKLSIWAPFLMLVAFFAVLILATVFSEDIRFSIFGSPARAGGLLNLLYYFIFSIILALFASKNHWEKLWNVLFVTGFLASLLAIVQYFNILKNIFIAFEGGSTPSFMGNSTILAIYMLFLAFLAFMLFVQKHTRKAKIVYGTLFILFTFTVFISGSRAGYLGLLVGFFYFFLFYPLKNLPTHINDTQNQAAAEPTQTTSNNIFWRLKTWVMDFFNETFEVKLKTVKKIAAFALLLAILAIVIFNVFPQLGEKNSILKTIATRVSVTSIAKDIAGTRLSAWKMTLEAIKDKPILGFGPENFYVGFEKYYDPKPFTTSVLLWDRPHNIFLDVAANSGIFSLLFYIAFWIALFWQLQKAKKSDYDADRSLKAHGLQAMFIGYLIVIFFNFDSFATYLISFFFIGYAFYLIFLPVEKRELTGEKPVPFKTPAAIALLALVLLFAWFWNIKPLYLNEKIAHAKNLSEERRCKEAFGISNKEQWEKAGIAKSHAILQYADVVKNCVFTNPQKEGEYSLKMASLLKTAAQAQPKFSRIWLFRGSFVNVLAALEENPEKKNAILKEAIDYLKKGLELSPKRQEIFSEIGKNYLIAQDYQAMEKAGQDCVAIDSRYGECWWHMGLAQIFLGKQEEGKKSIETSLENGYNFNPGYKQLAVAYMSQKNWEEAIEAYKKYNPRETSDTASYYAVLAFLYERAGQLEKAAEYALEVFKIQPENPETVPFIKLLLGKRPNNPILKSSLAFIYMAPGPQQELSKALAIYLQLADNEPQNTDYLLKLVSIYYELKDYDKAYYMALSVVKLDPNLDERMENFIKTLPEYYWTLYVNTHPY